MKRCISERSYRQWIQNRPHLRQALSIGSLNTSGVDDLREVLDRHNRDRAWYIEIDNPRLHDACAIQVIWSPVFIVITRRIGIARAKWYPANLICLCEGNKSDECGRISRRGINGVWNPEPLVSCVRPPAVVIRSIAPWLTGYPSWTIGIVSGPIALLVWRPTAIHAWSPAVSVAADVLPVAVIIEIVDAGYDLAHILITGVAPVRVEIVWIVQISIVVVIPTVVILRILVAVIVIDEVAGVAPVQA